MKTYDETHCQKLVLSGQWKKVNKLLLNGTQQEKAWTLDALGRAAIGNDECYNHLVESFLGAKDKETKIAAIQALGKCGRSAALSQLEYASAHTDDPELLDALKEARHQLRNQGR